MSLWEKMKAVWGGVALPSPPSTVGAVATAVGEVAGAVKAGEELADHKNLLVAGQSEGVLLDAQKTEQRVAAAGAARSDKRVLDDVEATRYRD